MTAEEKAEKLILAHDGDMALLYIYFSRRNTTDIAAAAKDLFITLSRAESAYEKLELQGFFDDKEKCEIPGNSSAPTSLDGPKLYSSVEIEKASEDLAFKALLQEAEQITGRILTKDDICKLLDIYKHLNIDAETIFVLLHYCELISTRKPRMSYISKIAYSWHQQGITDVAKAEAFVDAELSRRSNLNRIKAVLHIDDRELTSGEREIANSWLDYGTSENDISEAYDICITQLGKYNCAYINKILENWRINGKNSKKESKATAKPIPKKEGSKLPTSIRKKR